MPTKTQAIAAFLKGSTHPDLAQLYNHDMECQVNVAQDHGTRIDGEFKGKTWHGYQYALTGEIWKSFRIPYGANSDPFYDDKVMSYSLVDHAEGIGCTGWDWKSRLSRWVGFDFDAIVGHSDKHSSTLSASELNDVINAASNIPWVTTRRSTSGKGIHLYVHLKPIETKNHNEHAALARSILGSMSMITGFDFNSKVDVCVPSDTWTMTSNGPRQVKDLIDSGPIQLLVDGRPFVSNKGFFFTGKKEIFEVTTFEGHKYKATGEHKVLTQFDLGVPYGSGYKGQEPIHLWQETKNLRPGDKIHLHEHKNVEWCGNGTFEEGYILGWLMGDGSLSEHHGGGKSRKVEGYMTNGLCVFPDDFCCLHHLMSCFKTYPNIHYYENNNSYLISSREIEDLRLMFGIEVDKQISKEIEESSSDFQAGFISAFFDTDGSANSVEAAVELTQSDLKRLEAVQRMLLRFGINSSISHQRCSGKMMILGRECTVKDKYVLRIGRENVLIFNDRIGFKNTHKKEKNAKQIGNCSRKFAFEKFLATVKEVKSLGIEEVFDVTVEHVHRFDGNGVVLHNCGQVLWLWHRKMVGTDGLKLIKQGSLLEEPPINWKDHIDVCSGKTSKRKAPKFVNPNSEDDGTEFDELIGKRPKIKLDESHLKLITWLGENGKMHWYDHELNMLVAHTFDLAQAHSELNLKGVYKTVAQGKLTGQDHNCFCFPLKRGAWSIRRYGKGVQESETWGQDANGWTRCYYNQVPDFETAARSFGAIEHPSRGFVFRQASDAQKAVLVLGSSFTVPSHVERRETVIKKHKDGRLLVEIPMETPDKVEEMKGWSADKKKGWLMLVDIPANDLLNEVDLGNDEDIIRHLTTNNSDAGWCIKINDEWVEEPLHHVERGLMYQGMKQNEGKMLVGANIFRPWKLVTIPFQPEYIGDRTWNRNAPQLKYVPTKIDNDSLDNLKHKHWDMILDHIGKNLNMAVKENAWCKKNVILSGREYLKCWIASLFQSPQEPLPYLFLYGPQNSGKSIFHEAISLLLTSGVVRADVCLTNPSSFNAELEGKIVCVVEETDLSRNKTAYNRIKDYVTSRLLNIHKKLMTPYEVINLTHWIQVSNERASCPVFSGDSRITMISVESLPETQLIPKRELITRLEKEAPDFLASILNLELPESNDRLNLPILHTEAKHQAEDTNKSLLETFLSEECFYNPGAVIKLSEFCERFIQWLEPQDRLDWSKHRISKEIPSEMYPKGRLSNDSQYHYGNVSFVQPTEDELKRPPVICHNNKLVPKPV